VNDEQSKTTSVTRYLATVEDVEELMGICIGLLGESQSMSPDDRTIATNLLGDAAAFAADGGTNENARLLRITEAAIGGVAVGDNETIAALFQRHKTEMERVRRRAASAVDSAASTAESTGATEPMAPKDEPVQIPAEKTEPATIATEKSAEAPAARARKRAPGRKKTALKR
jgi:HEAT repeat protein